jgi:hypothetical protein
MTLPYQRATAGANALREIEKTLRHFGCAKVGHMMDHEKGDVIVQFEFRGRQVSARASINGYAAAWLRENPWSRRMRSTKIEHEALAKQKASVAVYSLLRDWIKGQITAVETGILTFEGAFLGQILLPSGQTVLEVAAQQNLLAAPRDEKVVPINGATGS